MRIRPFESADLPVLVELTIETFRPFMEGHVRPAFGAELFTLHHGQWEQDYRDELPAMHDPAARKWLAVAEVDGAVAGLVAWEVNRPDHGRIALLAVGAAYRRGEIGTRLCEHAVAAMTGLGVRVVEIGTGGADSFHAGARALYESLGFLKVPIAGYIKAV